MGLSRRLLVAIVPFVVACNAIIGLSDYSQGECSGGGSCSDGGFDAALDVAVDARDATTTDATGTQPVSWARWRMPNYPQDAGSDVIQTYVATTGGFKESVSGLTWQEPLSDANSLKTFADAQRVCAGLANGPWRLPTRIELVSLLDLRSKPTIDPTFKFTPQIDFWTSSEVRPVGSPLRRWTVSFKDGQLGQAEETSSAGVRCIRAL